VICLLSRTRGQATNYRVTRADTRTHSDIVVLEKKKSVVK